MTDFRDIWKGIPRSWKFVFFICMGATIGLLVGGFILPPPGEIDRSILEACFVIVIYPTLFTAFICVLRGMKVHYDIKEGQITIGKSHEVTAEEEPKN